MSSHNNTPLGISYLSESDRNLILEKFNSTSVSYSGGQTIVDLFESQVERTPDHVAVIFGDEQLSYREINERANQLAHYLRANSVRVESTVGICLNRSVEMIVGILGILKAGGAYVPIDPDYPADRISYMLEDIGSPILLGCFEQADLFSKISGKRNVLFLDAEQAILQSYSSVNISSSRAGATDLAYVIYTSGSTGKPKGVMIEHKQLKNYLMFCKDTYITSDSVSRGSFIHLSFSFDASITGLFTPLITGHYIVISDQERMNVFNDTNFIKYSPYQYLKLTPAQVHLLANSDCVNKRIKIADKLIFGGEALQSELLDLLPFKSGSVKIINEYGPTETTVGSTIYTKIWNSEDSNSRGDVPIGRPIANTRVYILDQQLSPVGLGITGELYIAGAGVARGYHNQASLTAERFLENPFSGGDELYGRMYRTGDLVHWRTDGNLEYQGRIDDQVKIRGYRVELGEVESILQGCSGVGQSVVTAQPDGYGGKRLVAYMIAKKAGSPNNKLRDAVSKLLPDYMVPSAFVWVDEFPLTTNGKVDRKALPKPDLKRPDLTVPYKKPVGKIEEQISILLTDILQYDKIGADDNFFELGGNSLLMQTFLAGLKSKLNYSLSITKLYQYPTISGIARQLGNEPAAQPVRSRKEKGVSSSADIAVIGMAGRFPGADSIDALWEILIEGRETTRFFRDEELDQSIPDNLLQDPAYVKARGVINNADQFDPAFFGVNTKLSALMDPQQRIFLEIAWELLEQTGHLPSKYHYPIGVFAGSGGNTYLLNNLWHRADLIDNLGVMQVMTVNEKDYLSSRTAYHLDLKGPAVSVNSACSTSLLAIAKAVNSLRLRQCDAALAGGVAITSPINSGHLYQEGSMLSADGHCRPFDDDATGTVFSDGAGVVLLKRLDDAEREGDKVYAVIKGVGLNNDGGSKGSFTAPSTEGQADAIASAIYDAGVSPDEITYVETHGTGTPIGDPIEFDGLLRAFGEADKKQYCAIGSVKSNFGHLTAAAGVAGFIKACLALHHGMIPPSLGFERPNRAIDFLNSPFYVNTRLSEWASEGKRFAGVSSFGVGGTNVHVILQDYQYAGSRSSEGRPFELINWSAKSQHSLNNYGIALKALVNEKNDIPLADISYALQRSRDDFKHRRFLVTDTTTALAQALDNKPRNEEVNILDEIPSDLVFVFPGQGAQYVNMASGLYQHEAVYRNALDECAELLSGYIDVDIRKIIFQNLPSEEAGKRLQETRYTQPALFATEYALAKLWMYWGIKPTLLCGHSVGEYVAAHLAGVFSLEDGLKLIAKRSALVNDLPRGSMLSVRENATVISQMLDDGLSIAAINSPHLCVVSGEDKLIEEFKIKLVDREIAYKALVTSHAFHSEMMEPVIVPFRNIISEIHLSVPKIPLMSTVTGNILTDAEATDPAYWAGHLRNTVDFTGAIETLIGGYAPVFLEIGPGVVTSTLISQIGALKSVSVTAVSSLKNGLDDHAAILNALGRLWSKGFKPDWTNYFNGQERSLRHLPPYQFDRQRYWVEPAGKSVQADVIQEHLTVAEPEVFNKQLTTEKDSFTLRIKQVFENASGINLTDTPLSSSFIEIGFDSLLLTQVATLLKREFNLPITFRRLNEEYFNLELLADYIASNLPGCDLKEPSSELTNALVQSVNPSPDAAGNTTIESLTRQLEFLTKQVELIQNNAAQDSAGTPEVPPLNTSSNTVSIESDRNREIEKIVAINESQREIWLSCAIGGADASLAYNVSVSLDLEGQFRFDLFRLALDKVVQRHEALRSTISRNGENLVVYRAIDYVFEMTDISGSPKEQEDILSLFIESEMLLQFDLEEGPLFRVNLHKLGEEHHYFTIVIHHLVGDGWSLGIILENLSKLYNDYVSGLPAFLKSGPQLSNYVDEQARFFQTEEFSKIETYWLDLYKDQVPVLNLPTDFPRPSTRTYKANRFDKVLPTKLVSALKATGAKSGCSLVNTLLSAFEIFLYQKTGQRTIVVGLPASGQSATENYDLVANCVNLLPLRSTIDPDLSFSEYLKIRKTAFFDAQDHQMFSFGQLIKKLSVKRDPSRIPLVPVVFNIDIGMDSAISFKSLRHQLISNPRAYETFEIFLNGTSTKNKFVLEWSYNTQLFKAETIEKMANDFESLLSTFALDADVKINAISNGIVNNPSLQESIVPEGRARSDAKIETVLQLLSISASKYSERTALSFGEENISYRDLDLKSSQLASFLIDNDINKGDIVGLLTERSASMIVCLLAILKAGCVYLPLDPEYPRDRIEFMVDDADAKILLVSQKYNKAYTTRARELIIDEILSSLNEQPTPYRDEPVTPADLAYIIYTSGSTGKPKGVIITHGNLSNLLLSMQSLLGIKPSDRLLAVITISFDMAGFEIYLPLISGAEVVVASSEAIKDGRMLLSIIKDKKINMLQATPSTFQMMVDSGWKRTPELRVFSGGEALSLELARKLLENAFEVWNMYGPTETTIYSTVKQISATDTAVTIGKPIKNTRIYITDPNGQEVSQGQEGEILIGGDGVAVGYLRRPELSNERFIRDQYSTDPHARIYKTGDLGKLLDNGEIQYLGRIDQQVKIRGYRIELGEIESILLRQTGIRQCVVTANEDQFLQKRLVAYVIPAEDAMWMESGSSEEIQLPQEVVKIWKDQLSRSLPVFMIPDRYVALRRFPVTPNGKIDRLALPRPDIVEKGGEIKQLPRTQNEQLVADIWKQAFDLPAIDITADFFELGGHSLLAIRVIVALEKATGKRFPLSILFEHSTIEKLAKQLSRDESDKAWEALVPIKTTGDKPPLFLIHGAGLNILLFKFISQYFNSDQPLYGIQALGLKQPTDIPGTLEEIAILYAREIIEAYPNGPYALAGYSLGGFLAYEIATQLKEMGKEIKFLGLMDTYAGHSNQTKDLLFFVKKITRQFSKVRFFSKSFIDFPNESLKYQRIVLKRKILKLFDSSAGGETSLFTPYEKQIYHLYSDALAQYQLAPADLKVTLFRVEKRMYYIDDPVTLGWKDFALKGVHIEVIPGDHKTFLYPPNDQQFAAIIQKELDKN